MVVDEDTYLEHFGVKGMKWGVRRQKRLNRANRVATGKASKAEKLRFAMLDTSAVAINNAGGLAGAARSRSRELQARKARIEKGKATFGDLVALNGGDKLFITGKGGSAKAKKGEFKTTSPSKYAGKKGMTPEKKVAIAAGAIFMSQVLIGAAARAGAR